MLSDHRFTSSETILFYSSDSNSQEQLTPQPAHMHPQPNHLSFIFWTAKEDSRVGGIGKVIG